MVNSMYHSSFFEYVLKNRIMKQTTYLVLLISNLVYSGVASDDSFLQMENLETYTANLMKIYDANDTNSEHNVSMSIQNFFAKLNNFTNSLEKIKVYLRFDTESISFLSYWEISEEIHDDLDIIFMATKNINEFFESYYIDFLDGFYTNRLIQHFFTKTIYSTQDGLYNNTAEINNIIFSQEFREINNNNFFDQISDKLNKNFNQLCTSHSTRQQFLTSLYSFIIKSEFRAFLMYTSAYKLKSIVSNDSLLDFKMHINRLRIYYLSAWSYYLVKMQPALTKTSTEYYDCQASHEYNYGIKNVYAIDLSPTIVGYKWNKVVTGVQFELRDGFLQLILYDGTLLENGKISTHNWDFRKHYPIHRHPPGYTFPENRKFDYKLSKVEYVHKSFWKNISFLHTKVPENHVVIGANFEVLKFNPNSTTAKKILYFQLHCVEVNTTTGKIDTSKIIYTKVWTKDDPELQRLSEIANDHSFKNNVQSIYNRVLINISNSSTTERWRRKPPLSSYIDSNIIKVYPPLPITGIGLWKNKYGKDSNHLSLKITSMDISSRIKSKPREND